MHRFERGAELGRGYPPVDGREQIPEATDDVLAALVEAPLGGSVELALISPHRAAVTLHMLTGLEAFVELRREGGLSLRQTIDTVRELALSLLRTK